MSTTTTPALGVVITNATVRKIIYGSYVIAIVLAGAIQVGFATIQAPQPAWLTAALGVLTYLGLPVGGLALANTSNVSTLVVGQDTGFKDSTVG